MLLPHTPKQQVAAMRLEVVYQAPLKSTRRRRHRVTNLVQKIEDMSDPEPARIKQEDTEEQTGWCPFIILRY